MACDRHCCRSTTCGGSQRTAPYEGPWNHVGYFHATYRDHGEPTFGEDLVFLDTRNVEGSPDWSGSLVGTSFVFTDRNVLTTLEGDPRFYFDDSRTPQVQGTGTEEWGGGGDYWGGRTMTLPLAGHPVGVVDAKQAKSPLDLIHSAYRFLLGDLMPFGQRAKICFEHGGENESVEHYRSVTHWYGLPSASLVLTDSLDIGDPQSETRASLSLARRHRAVRSHVALRTRPGSPVGGDRAAADRAGSFRRLSIRRAERPLSPVGRTARRSRLVRRRGVGARPTTTSARGRAREACTGLGGFLNLGRATGRVPVSDRERAGVGRRVRAGRYATVARSTADRPAGDRANPAEPEPDEAAAGGFRSGAGRDRADAGRCRRNDPARSKCATTSMPPAAARSFLEERPREIEIFPAETLKGRRTLGASEFVVRIRPDNHGVMLRRTLDYQWANQRAIVSVATDDGWVGGGRLVHRRIEYRLSLVSVLRRRTRRQPAAHHHVESALPRRRIPAAVAVSRRADRRSPFASSSHRAIRRCCRGMRRSPPPGPSSRIASYCFVMPRVTLD